MQKTIFEREGGGAQRFGLEALALSTNALLDKKCFCPKDLAKYSSGRRYLAKPWASSPPSLPEPCSEGNFAQTSSYFDFLDALLGVTEY